MPVTSRHHQRATSCDQMWSIDYWCHCLSVLKEPHHGWYWWGEAALTKPSGTWAWDDHVTLVCTLQLTSAAMVCRGTTVSSQLSPNAPVFNCFLQIRINLIFRQVLLRLNTRSNHLCLRLLKKFAEKGLRNNWPGAKKVMALVQNKQNSGHRRATQG